MKGGAVQNQGNEKTRWVASHHDAWRRNPNGCDWHLKVSLRLVLPDAAISLHYKQLLWFDKPIQSKVQWHW